MGFSHSRLGLRGSCREGSIVIVMPGVEGIVDVLAGEAEEREHDHAGDNVRATS